MPANTRFVVRRRGDGYAVVDSDHFEREVRYDTETDAEREADRRNNEPPLRTYGVTWYCEVDASDEADAAVKARKFLAPSYRENWEPTAVELLESDDTPQEPKTRNKQ